MIELAYVGKTAKGTREKGKQKKIKLPYPTDYSTTKYRIQIYELCFQKKYSFDVPEQWFPTCGSGPTNGS